MVKTSQILARFIDEYDKASLDQKRDYRELYMIFQAVLPLLEDSGR